MRQAFDRFTSISTADPDDTRRGKILNILLLGVGGVSIIAFILAVIVSGSESIQDTSIILIGSLIVLAGTVIIYFINARWSEKIAAILFLILLTAIFSFSDTPEQVSTGRSLFAFAIPIIMASILLTPWSSFIFAAISSIIISFLSFSINRSPNFPAIIGFFLIALTSWLSARSLESALKELRIINANLDGVVVERTQALSESLIRERIEAGRNQAILNSIADGVIVFDKQWNAMMTNPAIKGMLEIPLDWFAGKNFREIVDHPKLAPKSRSLLQAMLEHDTQPIGFRIEWGGKTLSVSAAQVYNDTGDNMGFVIVFRDVTREAEVEKLKSTFVAIVSHELRTPLNAILGYAEMFKEAIYGPMNDKQVNMADRIIKNTQRLLGLINDLLDQAQMEAGKLTIQMAPVRLSELLDNLHSVLDKSASDKGLKLTSEIDDFLPERVNGDGARLHQILINLVNNAIKFTDQGSILVRLFYYDENRWGIEVADTGRGIPESEMPYIFDTFRQVEGTATRVHGGFGLGLSIVKQLVNLMNGDVQVTSVVDEGTTFKIILPLVTSNALQTNWRV